MYLTPLNFIYEGLFNHSGPGFWEDFYPDAEEAIPLIITNPRVKRTIIEVYVDTDNAGNLINQRSHSRLMSLS